jgi:4-alpha-glucanotransferase
MVKTGRISGVLLPLFSLRSRTDFGIGDFGAIGGFLDWLRAGRQKMWMMLPLLPTAPGDTSPYATRSAFGLNPLDPAVRAPAARAGYAQGQRAAAPVARLWQLPDFP